jgi:hypothetical protein
MGALARGVFIASRGGTALISADNPLIGDDGSWRASVGVRRRHANIIQNLLELCTIASGRSQWRGHMVGSGLVLAVAAALAAGLASVYSTAYLVANYL